MKVFKYSVIGYNTAENRECLEKLGYKNMYPDDPSNFRYDTIAACKDGCYFLTNEIADTVSNVYVLEEKGYINCIGNNSLFKAVSALREDSDYMQWFISDIVFYGKDWFLCEKDKIEDCSIYCSFTKATLEELKEHFRVDL